MKRAFSGIQLIIILSVLVGCTFNPPKPEVIRGPTLTDTINAIKYEINKAENALPKAYALENAEFFYKIHDNKVQVNRACACAPDSALEPNERKKCAYTKKRPKKDLRANNPACLVNQYNEADRVEFSGYRPPLSIVNANFKVSNKDVDGTEIKVWVLSYKNTLNSTIGNGISFSFIPTSGIQAELSIVGDSSNTPFPDASKRPSVTVNGLAELITKSTVAVLDANSAVSPFCWKNFTVSAWIEATRENNLTLFKEWDSGGSVSLTGADSSAVNNRIDLIFNMPETKGKEIVCVNPVK